MKKLVLIALMSFAATSALATSLHPDTFKPSYTTFDSIAVDSVETAPLCPDDVTCFVNGTAVKLNYIVDCSEEMVSFEYEVIQLGKEIHIFANAVVGYNLTTGPTCLAFSKVDRELQLINMYGTVVIHNLGIKQMPM